MTPSQLALVALAALSAPGCFLSRTTVNEPVRREAFDHLQPGTTTAKDVTAAFGAPNEVVQLGTRSAYRYDFTVGKRAGFSIIVISFLNEDTHSDRVWLFFDAHDVLTHAGATLEAGQARFAMPWQSIHGD